MKICGCITEKNPQDVIKSANETSADLVEHRIDLMEEKELEGIYTEIDKPVIATNRRKAECGFCSETEEERINLLIKAIEEGCSYIDIELEAIEQEAIAVKGLLDKAKEKGCSVIVSYHDFNKTPSLKELNSLMCKQIDKGADIGKLVFMPKKIEDCHNMLELMLQAKNESFPLVAFCMGELGKFTRIASLKYGSPLMYASVNEAAAPGQIDVEKLKEIFEVL